MIRLIWAILALTGLVAMACAGGGNVGVSSATPNPDPYDESPTFVVANAAIVDPQGKVIGLASFRETRLGVRVEIKVQGLPPGKHGTHIHGVGKCDGPDFASAGGHFNINNQQHGVPGAINSHAGELPNLVVGPDGKGTLLYYSPHLSLNRAQSNGLGFGGGTSVIIHAQEDDYKTQPAGNSGARIACGIVKIANP
jgi:Cu-Zn family superoxide dismutase